MQWKIPAPLTWEWEHDLLKPQRAIHGRCLGKAELVGLSECQGGGGPRRPGSRDEHRPKDPLLPHYPKYGIGTSWDRGSITGIRCFCKDWCEVETGGLTSSEPPAWERKAVFPGLVRQAYVVILQLWDLWPVLFPALVSSPAAWIR